MDSSRYFPSNWAYGLSNRPYGLGSGISVLSNPVITLRAQGAGVQSVLDRCLESLENRDACDRLEDAKGSWSYRTAPARTGPALAEFSSVLVLSSYFSSACLSAVSSPEESPVSGASAGGATV